MERRQESYHQCRQETVGSQEKWRKENCIEISRHRDLFPSVQCSRCPGRHFGQTGRRRSGISSRENGY